MSGLSAVTRDAVIRFPALGLTLDPPASVTVFGRTVYFYGILIALGFLLGIRYCARHAQDFGLRTDDFYDLVLWLIPLSIVGARIYYVVFRWEYYSLHPAEIPAVWEGGLAIYGGILAGVLTAYLVCRHKKVSFPAMLDLMAFGVLIGQCIGRWGNFFNREAFGRETEIFCRMGLTEPDGATVWVHPTFLYESLWNFAGFLLLCLFVRKGMRRYDGQCALLYFFWYGLGRVWIEGLRSDSLYLGSTGIRISQLLSAVLLLGSAIILLINGRKTWQTQEKS